MADIIIARANEKIKSWSNALFNLGSALTAASAVRLYDRQELDISLVTWAISAALLIWVAHVILDLLESED